MGARDLHGVLGRPFPRGGIVAGPIRLEKLGDVRDKGVVGVGVSEEGADGEENF